MVDSTTKKTLAAIPLLKTRAGPQDGDPWMDRLKEEYMSLIQYVKTNKEADNDWFRLESNKQGTKWFGKCWYIHNLMKYEFDVEFEMLKRLKMNHLKDKFGAVRRNPYHHFNIPVTYPDTAPEIAIPELEGKTAKMYRGGKICLTEHFKPLWSRNVPKFGIGHAMALGLGPWLAVEIPDLIEKELIKHKEDKS